MNDPQFWFGLLLGAIFSIPSGVIAILLATRVTSYLERRKLIKTRKTKQQALRIYRRIKAFHEGTRDRYPFYIILASSSVLTAIAASTIAIVVLIISPNFDTATVWLAISAMLAIMSVGIPTAIWETARQLERFDEYKKEFEERWGPIDA